MNYLKIFFLNVALFYFFLKLCTFLIFNLFIIVYQFFWQNWSVSKQMQSKYKSLLLQKSSENQKEI